ncbi:MAG: LysR substrate-binding domain-containing protein, partial [Pseudomonadota bacterium]
MDTIDGMRSFVTAVEAGSFTAAADRLGLSKKLVSKYVAELEARLGTRLLHRTTRTLALTEAGSAAYAQCLDILDRVDALKSGSQAGTRDLAGTIRLSAPVTFGEVYLPSLLQSFAARHPRIEFDLRLNDRYVDLTDEGFDLAIRVGRLEASGLIARKLGVTRLLVVASPAYLAAHGAPAVPGDLKDHVCIRDTNLRGGIEWPLTSGEQIRRHRV